MSCQDFLLGAFRLSLIVVRDISIPQSFILLLQTINFSFQQLLNHPMLFLDDSVLLLDGLNSRLEAQRIELAAGFGEIKCHRFDNGGDLGAHPFDSFGGQSKILGCL